MTATDLPLHVEALGPDPGPDVDTFVLVHGYAASSFTWRYWAPRLAEIGHVVQIDLKGFGRAPKPADGRYAPSDQAALVTELLDRRDLRNVTLIGHSLGGGVALLVALGTAGEPSPRLSRLVLVAGVGYPQRLPPFVRMANWPRASSSFLELVGTRRVVEGVLRMIVHDSESVTEEQVAGYAGPLGSPEAVRALLSAAKQILPPDLDALARSYPTITVPTLLLWGREDRVVPLEVGRRLDRELPHARLHILERCGHLPAEEYPAESYAVLESFLRETS